MTKELFGKTSDGQSVERYWLTGANGMRVAVLTLGATIQHILVPNRRGEMQNVALSLDSVEAYEKDTANLGACIGRHSNRIGGAVYTWKGETYSLEANEENNNLHSGAAGFKHKVWTARQASETEITLHLTAPDGEGGFPGTMEVDVTYRVTDDNTLELCYQAVSDKDTPINITNHTYFNFSGRSEHIFYHELQISAEKMTEIGAGHLPTGSIVPVAGTVFDFRKTRLIGQEAFCPRSEQLTLTGGYDHNFVPDGAGYRRIAGAYLSETGIGMDVFTDQPGVQFYTGNFLEGAHAKNTGFCLETQHFPDSLNHENFPSVMLLAGEKYQTKTGYKFYVK